MTLNCVSLRCEGDLFDVSVWSDMISAGWTEVGKMVAFSAAPTEDFSLLFPGEGGLVGYGSRLSSVGDTPSSAGWGGRRKGSLTRGPHLFLMGSNLYSLFFSSAIKSSPTSSYPFFLLSLRQ